MADGRLTTRGGNNRWVVIGRVGLFVLVLVCNYGVISVCVLGEIFYVNHSGKYYKTNFKYENSVFPFMALEEQEAFCFSH